MLLKQATDRPKPSSKGVINSQVANLGVPYRRWRIDIFQDMFHTIYYAVLLLSPRVQHYRRKMVSQAPLVLDHVLNPDHDALAHSAVFSASEGNLFCLHCASER